MKKVKAIIRDVGKKWRVTIRREDDTYIDDYLVDTVEFERQGE